MNVIRKTNLRKALYEICLIIEPFLRLMDRVAGDYLWIDWWEKSVFIDISLHIQLLLILL